MKYFYAPYIISLILSIIIFGIYFFENDFDIETKKVFLQQYRLNGKYQWPVVGYNRISSYFGYRNAPTGGASTNHTGIDIAAPTGSNLVSSITGKVIHIGFKGAGGHTIIIANDNIEVAYCHVDSKYYPKLGSIVLKGQVIGRVGPKNIYDVENNPYKDSKGLPTNGATTGAHLHFSIKINNSFVNPLEYISE